LGIGTKAALKGTVEVGEAIITKKVANEGFQEFIGNGVRSADRAFTGVGKFKGNLIKVYNHNSIKVAIDETRGLILSIRPFKGFHF